MSYSLIDTPNVPFLERYLDLTTYRQTLLAANVANIDTPGYQTRDVAFQGELAYASLVEYREPLRPFARAVQGLMVRPDGNNVSLDREARLLAENDLRFNIASNLMRGQIKTLRMAIDGGGSSSS